VVVVLAAVSSGCGLGGQSERFADTAQVLGQFADRLGQSADLTYAAEYRVSGGDNVTVLRRPPKALFANPSASFIVTPEYVYVCEKDTCQRAVNNARDSGTAYADVVAGITGPGFVTPQTVLGLIAAAAFGPGTRAETSERTIAGESSSCADVTNHGAEDAPPDFTVCVTEAGVLASFRGTTPRGRADIELVQFSSTVDEIALDPPHTATIVDVTAVEPPR